MRKAEETNVSFNKSHNEVEDDEEKLKLNNDLDDSKVAFKGNSNAAKKLTEPSLGLCLIKIFSFKYIGLVSIKLSNDVLNFARPILLE